MDVSIIKINQTPYNIKDTTARSSAATALSTATTAKQTATEAKSTADDALSKSVIITYADETISITGGDAI